MIENKSLIWDETFPSLLLKGEGASSFLHGQTTADVLGQESSNRIFISCWLSTKGSLKALLEIRLSTNLAQIVIISGEIKSLIDGFESVIFPADKVKLETVKPIRRIQKINNINSWKGSEPKWIYDNLVSESQSPEYSKATQEELEVWKIRQGIPSLDREINGETNPYELGLGDAINLDKGCYLGQESIARLYRSKSLKYQLRFWQAHGENNDLNVGKNLFNTNKDEGLKRKIGFITSSIKINDNSYNGLALIKNKSLEKDFYFSENGESIIIKQPISFTQPY